MRKFETLPPNEKIKLTLCVTAKNAAKLEELAHDAGLTMSGYLNAYLQSFIVREEK